MKLALGTVQFGLNYGISNSKGQVPYLEIEKILNLAKEHLIDTLDTAQAYGQSEKVLGQFDLTDFKIITKLIGNSKLEDSLENLNIENVYALMFHHEEEINNKSWRIFEEYKRQKMVQKIGVSVYTPETLSKIIDKYPIDIVQLPLNILDQRFLPLLSKLKEKDIEVHTRSTFLQGLLLMNKNDINPYFKPIMSVLEQLPKNKLEIALEFVNSIESVHKIIIGVTSKQELSEIVDSLNKDFIKTDFSRFIIEDEKFILPQNWSLL
jgi:aryl-alcohol dehydrogenase-like predicted oxidoreductase